APGPTNQKLVPGAWHCALTSPVGEVCSTSSPCASAPVALTMTPPPPGLVIIGAFGPPAISLTEGLGASGARVRLGRAVLLSVVSAGPAVALPVPVSRVTAALPCCALPGTETAARCAAVLPRVPGDGHARVAVVTSARWATPRLAGLPMVEG